MDWGMCASVPVAIAFCMWLRPAHPAAPAHGLEKATLAFPLLL